MTLARQAHVEKRTRVPPRPAGHVVDVGEKLREAVEGGMKV